MRADLQGILREVATASDLDEALAIIVRRIKGELPVDFCAVYLTDAASDQPVRVPPTGPDPTLPIPFSASRQAELLSLVVERRELVVLTNAAERPPHGSPPQTGPPRFDSFLGMPLIHDHRVLGMLMACKKLGRFDPDELTFFLTIAAPLAEILDEAATAGEVARLLSGEVARTAFIQGVQAAAGLAIGTAALLDPLATLESVPDRRVQDVASEENEFRAAVAAVQSEMRAHSERLAEAVPREVREIFDVYGMLLGSEELAQETVERIRAGNWAPGAWRDTISDHARVFDRLDDPYLRARGEDLRDIGERILRHLQSQIQVERSYPERCVLVGDTIGIPEMAAVPMSQLVAVVCRHGSAVSHTAVLARAFGIPAVTSLSSLPVGLLEGHTIVVDGDQGRIYIEPGRAALDGFERHIAERKAASRRLAALRDLPAETPDGFRVPLHANIGWISDTEAALASGAEGVGLYRTEYQFLLREAFPLENEQYEAYRRVLEAFAPRPVTIRTLDVGGDKILPYFSVKEDNPFLGCRGIRFSLEHPEIFMIQLRAMLRANAGLENLQVLFPMVSRVSELDQALTLLARTHRELLEEREATAIPKTGVMIEVPSAVFLTGFLAERVDFLSVGTNDLAQYILAADRTNERVGTPHDSLHPAVLDAVREVVQKAHQRGTPVSVCGELAGDPEGALVLLAMEIDALSMSPASLSRVKLAIRSFTVVQARALLEMALEKQDGPAVHQLLNSALEDARREREIAEPFAGVPPPASGDH
jgi:phosphotransferase system enzyme I (PtsP)